MDKFESKVLSALAKLVSDGVVECVPSKPEEKEEMIVYKKCKMIAKPEDIQVGDQIEVQLRNMGTFTATAQQITENGVIFMFDDCVARHSMNSECTNKGGYVRSELHKWINETLFEAFPDELKSRIQSITLPTYGQIFGHDEWYNNAIESDADEQFPLMKTRKNRIACFDNDTAWYWLKNATKKSFSSGGFADVGNYGIAYWVAAGRGNRVRPVFIIG